MLSLCVVVLVQYSVWLLDNSSIQKKGGRQTLDKFIFDGGFTLEDHW